VGLPHAACWTEHVRLAGAGRGPAHVHADDRPGGSVEEDRRAAGVAHFVGGVTYEHARYVAEVA
jgi:hypothetical protein